MCASGEGRGKFSIYKGETRLKVSGGLPCICWESYQVPLEEQPVLFIAEPPVGIILVHTKVFVVEGTGADTHSKDSKGPRQSVDKTVINNMDQGGDRKGLRHLTSICGAFRFLF